MCLTLTSVSPRQREAIELAASHPFHGSKQARVQLAGIIRMNKLRSSFRNNDDGVSGDDDVEW